MFAVLIAGIVCAAAVDITHSSSSVIYSNCNGHLLWSSAVLHLSSCPKTTQQLHTSVLLLHTGTIGPKQHLLVMLYLLCQLLAGLQQGPDKQHAM